jgi:hypothetical protein
VSLSRFVQRAALVPDRTTATYACGHVFDFAKPDHVQFECRRCGCALADRHITYRRPDSEAARKRARALAR